MGVLYRLGQFWRMWTAGPLPAAVRAEIAAVLTPQEMMLFNAFLPHDQWHSYRVWRTLQAAGQTQPDLLAAALLHDVGKTRLSLSLWERSLIVLAEAFLPRTVAAWGKEEMHGWRRPFAVKRQHPAWGAEMARAAGCRPLTVSLIRRHQEKLPSTAATREEELLRWLQWADDQN